MRAGFIIGLGKMKIDKLTDEELDRCLEDDRYFSINMNNSYYVFVDKSIDTNNDIYAHTLVHLNQELLILTGMDKEDEVH